MQDATSGLEPASLWRHFEALTKIPRPSRKEDAALAYVSQWAAGLGLQAVSAGGRNLLVRVRATEGRESAPTVILQGHTDMVCERNPDSQFDPTEGRIGLLRDGDWLTADGTTLGADDGIGVAAMMAAVDDGSVIHGPLELLFTTAEEVGLEGVKTVDGATLTGRMLLNLDSEEDGVLTVGCAGSTDTFLRLDVPLGPVEADDAAVAVTVGGGAGGHSGVNIAQGHANAIKVLARSLREALGSVPFKLAALDGGKSRNAIPRDARAVVVLPAGRVGDLTAAIAAADAAIRDAFAHTDPGVTVSAEPTDLPDASWSEADTRRVLDAIATIPSGLITLSPEFAGLVEMSSSLGVAASDGGQLELHSLTRTSNEAALADVTGALEAIAELAQGSIEVRHGYAGWRPELQSPLLASCVKVWTGLFGREPVVTAIHAGLETALIGEKVDGLDMLSIGPQIEFPHSPDERVSVPTVERFWRFLVGVLDTLSA
jgi:dipeptidase D